MFKFFIPIFLILILGSCRQGKELKYTTETLDCLTPLLDKQNKGDDKEILAILDKHSDDFKFAADLKSNFKDKSVIKTAEQAALKGELNKAKSILEERIIERGFSETLESSINNIDKALKLQKYIQNSGSMGISERVREFSQVKAHTEVDYKTISAYKVWLKKEAATINLKAQLDRQQIIESYKFVKDYLALNNPKSQEILLLEIANAESSSQIQGTKSAISQETFNKLTSKGIQQTVSTSYSSSGKNLRTLELQGAASLQDQLIKTHLLAKAGQISKTLESLQELQELCEVNKTFRRKILKDLFIAKGWNDASLINRDFVDISYLLETVYKANQ